MNTRLGTRRYIQPFCALINALRCSLVRSKGITRSRRVFTRPRDGTAAPVRDTSELGKATLSEQTSDRRDGSSGHRPACGSSAAAWRGGAHQPRAAPSEFHVQETSACASHSETVNTATSSLTRGAIGTLGRTVLHCEGLSLTLQAVPTHGVPPLHCPPLLCGTAH